MNRRFCFTLDLKNDPALIAEYKKYHEKIWPEITDGIKNSGIEDLEIYLFGTRMFMIMEVNESFSFDKKVKADQQNPKVQESAHGADFQAGKLSFDHKVIRGTQSKPQLPIGHLKDQ